MSWEQYVAVAIVGADRLLLQRRAQEKRREEKRRDLQHNTAAIDLMYVDNPIYIGNGFVATVECA